MFTFSGLTRALVLGSVELSFIFSEYENSWKIVGYFKFRNESLFGCCVNFGEHDWHVSFVALVFAKELGCLVIKRLHTGTMSAPWRIEENCRF